MKEGDLDGAGAVLEQLIRLQGRTAAVEDIVVSLVKKALGKTVAVKSVPRDAERRRETARLGMGRAVGETGIGPDVSDPAWLTGMNQRYTIIKSRPDAVFDLRGTERGLLKPLKVAAFHLIHANKLVNIRIDGENKSVAQSRLWIAHPHRRNTRRRTTTRLERNRPARLICGRA